MTTTLLTTADAALVLGVSRKHMQYLVRSGKLPATRYGVRGVLVAKADVEAYKPQHPTKGRPRTGATRQDCGSDPEMSH